MKERPINLRQHEAAAIVAERQTQLRRPVKDLIFDDPSEGKPYRVRVSDADHRDSCIRDDFDAGRVLCPYGQPGDRLWGRETTIRVEEHGYKGPVYVASDDGQACLDWGLSPSPDDCAEVEPHELKLRPSLHMPRSMSRITLEITGVRVERVQGISEEGAIAEGLIPVRGPLNTEMWEYSASKGGQFADPRAAYGMLWDSIHGPGSWYANPFVWVIEFRRLP